MRIKQLDVSSFRGIPNKLSISFPINNNRPISLIILGDNGVGKSSIVDAIEFCLQGHISQSKFKSTHTTPSLGSLYSNALPEISVTLENNQIFSRKLIKDEQGFLSNITQPHNLFSISPFVLRRHDILRFIDSSEAERTLVFSNYLRQAGDDAWTEYPIDQIKRLQDERLNAKTKRDDLIRDLATQLNINEKEIPFTRSDFKEFVKENIYKGFSKYEFESKGYKIKINEKANVLAEDVYKAIEEHREIKNRINKFSISADNKSFPKHLLNQLEDFLVKVGDKLTKSFLEISPLKFVESIKIKYDNQSVLALSLVFVLNNKTCCTPNQILSEANLDLLALLFFLSFIQESAERGQSKLLILDDVLQSVDSTIRVSFITYLLKNFSDWQFIITAHDRLWHRQLVEMMNLHGHKHCSLAIVDWSFESGPKIKIGATNIEESLQIAIGNNDLYGICSQSGLLLEQICDGISKNLNTTIQRRKDDKYTLGDLWPGIVKDFKKTSLREQVEAVEKWLHLRNLIGAHYNEWALSLSLEESKSFGHSVTGLLDLVKCKKCSSWLLNSTEFNFFSCKCGAIQIYKK